MDSKQMEIPEALQKAIEAHKSGKLQDAERIYRAILQVQPNHPDANHNLGVLAVQVGKPEEGLPYFKLALETNPKIYQFWISYVDALVKLGKINEAMSTLRQGKVFGLQKDLIARIGTIIENCTKNKEKFKDIIIKNFSSGNYLETEKSSREFLRNFPDDTFGYKALGSVMLYLKNNEDAIDVLKSGLSLSSRDPEIYNFLGVACKELAKYYDAIVYYKKALEIKPDYAEVYHNILNAYSDVGDLEGVRNTCKIYLEKFPYSANIYLNKGVALQKCGEFKEALSSYEKALENQPKNSLVLNNIGALHKELKNYKKAIKYYCKALYYNHKLHGTYYNLGIVYYELGAFEKSIKYYKKSLDIKPNYAEAYNNIGTSLRCLGRFEEAILSYLSAIQFKHNFAEAYNNIGVAYKEQGDFKKAFLNYEKALNINHEYAEAYNNIGNAFQDCRMIDEAIINYKKAICIKHDYFDAYNNLGGAFLNCGKVKLALNMFRDSYELHKSIVTKLLIAQIIPIVPSSTKDIRFWRKHFLKSYVELETEETQETLTLSGMSSPAYYLAYHNFNDRILMEKMSVVYRNLLNNFSFCDEQHLNSKLRIKKKKIRIGIISEYLKDHTIGKLNLGFVKYLDREKFEIYIFHFSRLKNDSVQNMIDGLADAIYTIGGNYESMYRLILNCDIDVIFYPEIGMSFNVYVLAFFRLAPVQVVSWGHPDTTGLTSIDYFYSSKIIEPLSASSHYTERLILSNRLPCCYIKTPKKNFLTKKDFNLPDSGRLYGCPQSLFKIHPDFDRILCEICMRDGNSHIVMIAGTYKEWTEMLVKRWEKKFPELIEKVIFLNRIPEFKFLSLLSEIDVLLDPIYFGSGNTLYEAMLVGTPIVTWPGKFMRGRIVAGAYRQMKIENPPIAERLEEYAQVAVALANDEDRLVKLRKSLSEAAEQYLFNDMLAVKEFEFFLENAVIAAEKGERLPNGWSPNLFSNLLGN